MKAKLAKVLRVTTIPPLFALYLVLLLWWQVPGFFASGTHLAVAIACLTVFPTLSYPTTWLTKKSVSRIPQNATVDGNFLYAGRLCRINHLCFCCKCHGTRNDGVFDLCHLRAMRLADFANKVPRQRAYLWRRRADCHCRILYSSAIFMGALFACRRCMVVPVSQTA